MSDAARRGRFITLEGIEGVGKSTHVDFVAERLTEAGRVVLITREPGGTALAEQIRSVVLAPRDEQVEPLAEVLLMFAARRQHVARVIEPALAQGQWVICDRFTDATLAYQGYGRGFSLERIRTLADWCHADAWPDLTLLLDVSVATSVARRATRGSDADRFEAEQQRFFEAVRQGYLELAAAAPERFTVIDAEPPLDDVRNALRGALDQLLEAVD
ncbi:MAG: dTMP kinase [Pseudomonadota bacterium]